MSVVKLYEGFHALVQRKLGACPKCMVSSIVGSGVSWIAVAGCYVLWPNPIALALGVFVAGAFTALMIAHVVAHMYRAAPIVRYVSFNRKGEVEYAPENQSRRQFAVAVAKAGYAFAFAAVASIPVFGGKTSNVCVYCAGIGCSGPQAIGGGPGVASGCVFSGIGYGSIICRPCPRTGSCLASLICNKPGCENLVLEIFGGVISCGPCDPNAVSVSLKCMEPLP